MGKYCILKERKLLALISLLAFCLLLVTRNVQAVIGSLFEIPPWLIVLGAIIAIIISVAIISLTIYIICVLVFAIYKVSPSENPLIRDQIVWSSILTIGIGGFIPSLYYYFWFIGAIVRRMYFPILSLYFFLPLSILTGISIPISISMLIRIRLLIKREKIQATS
jgi:hypothetical protein